MVVPFIMAPPRQLDEEYDVLIVAQSLLPESDGTQEVTDQRCGEMLGEIVGLFASSDLNAVLRSTEAPFCVAEITGWRPHAGRLTSGHGTRFEVTVHVHARLALS